MKNEPVSDITLLYVEDDEFSREELESYLKRRVPNVHVASNGEEGYELYKKYRPDIIITDIMMPKMTGIEMAHLIRQEDKTTKIIITSAYSDNTNLDNAVSEGIDTFLTKPIDLTQLYCTLKITIDNVLLKRKNLKTKNELSEAQLQLVENDKMANLGELVAGVTHEINTPLGISVSSISHLLDLSKNIKKEYESDTMTQESFESFLNSCEELSKMTYLNLDKATELIKSFKQIAVDQTSERVREFRIKEYISEIVFSLHYLIKKTNISINVVCEEDVLLNSYPGFFSQVFTNLITNSLKHGFEQKQEGKITIEINKIDENLELIYSDNGKGISQENQKKIFEPFFTTKQNDGGSGLGLCIIKDIVEKKLKGNISFSSVEGNGVKFTMVVPLTS